MDMAAKERIEELEEQLRESLEREIRRESDLVDLRNEIQLLKGQIIIMRSDPEYTYLQ